MRFGLERMGTLSHMTEKQKDPALMTEAEQKKLAFDRQQEVAARTPLDATPDVGTQQGWVNAGDEQKAYNEERKVPNPFEAGTQSDVVTGSGGGMSTPAKKAAPAKR